MIGSTRDERGAATVELVIVVPALVVMLGLMVAGGRLWFAKSYLTDAAQSGARAASLARTAQEAVADGRSAARQAMATAGLRCAASTVSIDAGAFAAPVGVPATVGSTLTCRIAFSDVLLPGMPGTVSITRSGSAALDTYRARS
jgi:Flp pilus assembly protein TadG